MKRPVIGVLGGGQLGRMLLQEAYNFDADIHILDPDPQAPCRDLAASFTVGDFRDYDTVMAFGADKDVMSIEFEDVNADALTDLEKQGKKVFPQPSALKIIKDKGLQKQFYAENGFPTSPFFTSENVEEARQQLNNYPYFQKLRTSGYDGYGVKHLPDSAVELMDGPSMFEEAVDILKELSVIVARNEGGDVTAYPCVELEFNPEANMVEYLFSPADIDNSVEQKAIEIAKGIIEKLDMVGILAVEFFLDKQGDILVNEVAPRPHNSGHQTIEGNWTSQYQQLLRCLLGLPLGDTGIKLPSVMVNILGEKGFTGDAIVEGMDDTVRIRGAFVHLYGKRKTKPFRKMGHVTVVNKDLSEAKALALQVKQTLKIKA